MLVLLFLVTPGSGKYSDAVRDVKLFFPEGLCCPSTVDLMAEGVRVLAILLFTLCTNTNTDKHRHKHRRRNTDTDTNTDKHRHRD